MVEVEPGFRVLHVPAGPCAPVPLPRAPRPRRRVHRRRARGVLERSGTLRRAARELLGVGRGRPPAEARARPPARHHVPHARARQGRGRARRATCPLRPRVEAEVVRCADLVVASTREEQDQLVRHYGADPDRIEIIAPGVDHQRVLPGRPRRGASSRSGSPTGPVAAVRRSHPAAEGRRPRGPRARRAARPARASSSIVGGPSGPDGDAEVAALHALVAELGLEHRVRFVAPQPHEQLVDYYRAADVCVVPSQHRVVRARRARGGRVRHAGRRSQRRRAAAARRRRRHRLPGRPTATRRSTRR